MRHSSAVPSATEAPSGTWRRSASPSGRTLGFRSWLPAYFTRSTPENVPRSQSDSAEPDGGNRVLVCRCLDDHRALDEIYPPDDAETEGLAAPVIEAHDRVLEVVERVVDQGQVRVRRGEAAELGLL